MKTQLPSESCAPPVTAWPLVHPRASDAATPLNITLEQAVELLKQPKGRRGAGSSSVLAELGAHPGSGAAIQVKDGRYGAYVTDGVVNATVPKGKEPAALTLDEAVELLAVREEKLRAQGKDPRAPKTRKPARKGKTTKTRTSKAKGKKGS
jgi:DNA topoisomerase-1